MPDGADDQYERLREATGRLVTATPGGASGTAFLVAPNVLLTAAHVVAPAVAAGAPLEFHWQGRVVAAVVKQVFPEPEPSSSTGTYPYPDLAIVEVGIEGVPVPLLGDEPKPGDELYAYGYTDEYPDGDSALFVYEGPTSRDELLYRLKDAQA